MGGMPASMDESGGAHVYLSSAAVRERNMGTASWWHDEAHDCVISLRPILDAEGSSTDKLGLCVDMLPGASHGSASPIAATTHSSHGSFSHGASFVDVKLSIDCQFFAVQRNDIEVDVWATATSDDDASISLRYSVMCKRTSRLLGLYWNAKDIDASAGSTKVPSQYLTLVTTGGLEVFKLTSSKCKFHRVLAYSTHLFWWHPQQHVVVLATGSKATELRPFFVDGGNLAKISKVVVSAPLLTTAQVGLAYLYSTLYLVYSSTSNQQLLLYRVHPSVDTVCVRALRVGFPDPVALSVVDNLLVVHSATYGVSSFYDVALADADPFLHPLPLHMPMPTNNTTTCDKVETAFMSPHFALASRPTNDDDMTRVLFHAIRLNLHAIAACATASARPMLSVARFLLRRRGGTAHGDVGGDDKDVKEALFASFRTRLHEGRWPEADFRACVHMLHHHEATDAMKMQSNILPISKAMASATTSAHLLMHVSQHDWFVYFWQPLQHVLPPPRLSMFLVIFLDSLRQHAFTVSSDLLVLYIQSMATQHRCAELVAFPMDDSVEVAHELELHEGVVPAMHQVAMDMYHRLGAVDDLVRLFLRDGHVTLALRLTLRYASSKKHISHSPKWFFDQVVAVATKAASTPSPDAVTCDQSNVQARQYLYALYVFLCTFAPAALVRDDRGRSQLSYECTFPEHLCTPSDKELQINGSSNDDDPSVHFRRLFGFSDNGHGT
ncbi:hypothetical protein, variant 1 [Aphanomyces astaci]|uniref:Uncharacterized protein n=1 Tax=Aphanomyces astaci TaxID=112090 RepID=W4FU10_APHAT|nr:hypothetical protein, variant 1 [Aphanomyces astaci]ETV70985.1 hypothetical protein, variant 1 [Aphanomyces astaci]|eukprot:XP_009839649.1 hypothetical protein, variant 1 [Aphanomyces astaci]